jgi:hypothetical protein
VSEKQLKEDSVNVGRRGKIGALKGLADADAKTDTELCA